MLDAYSRRHEAQKIYLRQAAAQRWVGWREQVLQGQRPHAGHTEQLANCDAQLRVVSRDWSPIVAGKLILFNRNSQQSRMIPFTRT
jgi:hypothetical protein